jgi:hypothetical protein
VSVETVEIRESEGLFTHGGRVYQESRTTQTLGREQGEGENEGG